MNAIEEPPYDVAAEADRVRARLLRTVEKLDQKRHDATNLPLQLRSHAYGLAVAGGVGILLIGIEQFFAHRRAAAAAKRRRRWQLLTQLWADPERALHSERRPFLLDAIRSVGLGLITAAATAPVRGVLARRNGALEAHGTAVQNATSS